jgi:hypothetical protein
MEKIDAHIYRQINMNTKIIKDDEKKISIISPAESFNNYLLEYKSEIIEELKNQDEKITKQSCESLVKKYKKIYKNRFYNIRVSLNK